MSIAYAVRSMGTHTPSRALIKIGTVVDVPFAKGVAVSSPSFSTLDIRLYIHLAEARLAANGRDEARERRNDCEGGKGSKETGGKECEEHEERSCEQLTAFPK